LAGLALTDKIAFAARFLSDRQLADYLEREWLTLLAAGSIQVSSQVPIKKKKSLSTGIAIKNKIVRAKKMDPDPTPFLSDFKDVKKKIYFIFFLITYPEASVWEIQLFANILC
jgi:hypothetical protein